MLNNIEIIGIRTDRAGNDPRNFGISDLDKDPVIIIHLKPIYTFALLFPSPLMNN